MPQTSRGCKVGVVPRSGPSRADAELLSAAAARGCAVSFPQLERWRTMGLVPRNVRHGCGRGRGSVSVAAAGALDMLIAAASDARQGRKQIMGDPLMQAAIGRPTRPGALKAAITRQFDRACIALGAGLKDRVDPDAAGDARFEAASRATRRGSYGATRELAGWVATGVEPEDVPVARSAMRDMLQSVASGGQDVSLDDLAAAAAKLGYNATGDPDVDGIYTQIEAGRQIPATSDGAELSTGDVGDDELQAALANWSLPAIRDRVNRIGEAELTRAAAVALQVQTFQGMIMLFGMPRVAGHAEIIPAELAHWSRPEVAQQMVADPTWRTWTYAWPAALGTKRWLDGFAFIVGMAAVTDITDELEAYATRLQAAVWP